MSSGKQYPPLAYIVMGVLMLIGIGQWFLNVNFQRQTQQETESAFPDTPVPTQVPDPFHEAIENAVSASEKAQTADNAGEWEEVATLWQNSIELMKVVPESSPNYSTAQQKALEYQPNLEYASSNELQSRYHCQAYVPTKNQESRGLVGPLGVSNEAPHYNDRSLPLYEGLVGYVSVKSFGGLPSIGSPEFDSIWEKNWQVPLYEWAGPSVYAETSARIPHKTEVTVIKQWLRHKSYTTYIGVLEVVETSSGESFLISHHNFVPLKYWECPIQVALEHGPIIAEIQPDASPINRRGTWVALTEEKQALCKNRAMKHKPRIAECTYAKKQTFFNPDNLKITY